MSRLERIKSTVKKLAEHDELAASLGAYQSIIEMVERTAFENYSIGNVMTWHVSSGKGASEKAFIDYCAALNELALEPLRLFTEIYLELRDDDGSILDVARNSDIIKALENGRKTIKTIAGGTMLITAFSESERNFVVSSDIFDEINAKTKRALRDAK